MNGDFRKLAHVEFAGQEVWERSLMLSAVNDESETICANP